MMSLSVLAGRTVSSLAHAIHFVRKMHSPVVGDNTNGSHMLNKPCVDLIGSPSSCWLSVSQTIEIITYYFKNKIEDLT